MIRFTEKLSTRNYFLVDKLSSIIEAFRQGIKQKRCHFCDDSTFNDEAICTPCYCDLPWNTDCCSRCALPMNIRTTDISNINTQDSSNNKPFKLVCGECISNPAPFTLAIACFRYEVPIGKAIQLLKYSHKRYFAIFFARLLTKRIQQEYIDTPIPSLLLPVPMHKKKLKERGFNQAFLISQQLSKSLSIPTNTQILQKVRSTIAQTGLDKRQRMQNLKGAFTITKPISGLHIALIDDVMTTRATADLLCKLLLDAGAQQVDVWCIARTAKYRHKK